MLLLTSTPDTVSPLENTLVPNATSSPSTLMRLSTETLMDTAFQSLDQTPTSMKSDPISKDSKVDIAKVTKSDAKTEVHTQFALMVLMLIFHSHLICHTSMPGTMGSAMTPRAQEQTLLDLDKVLRTMESRSKTEDVPSKLNAENGTDSESADLSTKELGEIPTPSTSLEELTALISPVLPLETLRSTERLLLDFTKEV